MPPKLAPPRLPPKIRKFESGTEKRRKKKKIAELIESQTGALDKFIVKETQIPIDDSPVDTISVDVIPVDAILVDNVDAMPIPIDDIHVDVIPIDDNVVVDVDVENLNDNEDDNQNVDNVNDIHISVDIFDPRNWDSVESKMIELLATKGPIRDLSIVKGSRDKSSRRFTANLYTRTLSNGEKCDRDWLVYSKELDRLFCFCCKVFKRGTGRGQLANEGFSDWSHVFVRLKEHEARLEHIKSMTNWYELRQRMNSFQIIDKTTQKLIEKEKDHWKSVLKRIIAIVKFLVKHNLAFRGSVDKLDEDGNGNFLGLIEMLNEFDPCVQEHVRRVTVDNLHVHYLGPRIQNELILLLASKIKNQIIERIKQAKYFSVILDCTPDISHQKQMSLIIRYVDVSSNSVSIEESFLGFLNVNDTTGQGLFER
ncbi:zinc finger MYM-type protein 1-like [Medicago truncatula]|uniref:zinc finger MYM-type protein 1-like n=1 Tax=Medicago truncatula TaxID=3880 RepID=UPI00196833CE|nr:zinc finger MYM-type protein 1-like [Medicago truncatula]